ncbi:hypothetical protein GQ55_2G422900 [Panicum hallii var. hallii]|uniref:DUF6598 domain-containing protein n=1 Tax=Panicum hallii var. hallii TaxID=1504633 RepID=A0A2T7EY82_9POAL|nr:hypothetical protein GQ55_2G422900 [Panicum hallii var. hallii]
MRGESEGTALWRVRKAELANEATMERVRVELGCGDLRKVEDLEVIRSDYEAWVASQFRDDWTARYSPHFGSFDDTTRLRPMRFTDEPAPGYTAFPMGTLQVFTVKVAGIKRGLQWPLDVFGFVAVRDSIDKNRNIIFNRTRNNCQTLTEKDRYFVLTGPTCAVVWPAHVTIEVKLTMKGTTESEDKDLSFLAVPLSSSHAARYSYLFRHYKTSKVSTLEFTFGHIVESVEATIFVRVIDGSWPDSCCGQFAAFSTGVGEKGFRTIDSQKIILLDSRGEKVLVTGDGEIELLRRVVSVEKRGTLKVYVKSWDWETSKGKKNVAEDEWVFAPQEAKRSYGRLDTGFCKMEVTVAWSLISYEPVVLNV